MVSMKLKKISGGIILFASLSAGMVFYSDLERAKAFEDYGVKTRAVVVEVGAIANADRIQGKTDIRKLAVGYEYEANGIVRSGRSSNMSQSVEKGDVLDVEYLSVDPSISRRAGNATASDAVRSAIYVCMLFAMIGALLLFLSGRTTSRQL